MIIKYTFYIINLCWTKMYKFIYQHNFIIKIYNYKLYILYNNNKVYILHNKVVLVYKFLYFIDYWNHNRNASPDPKSPSSVSQVKTCNRHNNSDSAVQTACFQPQRHALPNGLHKPDELYFCITKHTDSLRKVEANPSVLTFRRLTSTIVDVPHR